MTKLPFDKDILYKKYNKSFLQQAVVVFHYTKENVENIDYDKWKKYTQEMFSTQIEKSFIDDKVVIGKKDGSIDYLFSKDLVAVRIQGNDYVSFGDTVIPQVYRMRKFIKEVVGLDAVDGFDIRKWDLWQVRPEKNDASIKDEIVHFFLSDQFLNYNENQEDAALIPKESFIKGYKWIVDDEKKLRVNSSIVSSKEPKEPINLMLYSDCEIRTNILLDKVEEKLENANLDLFKIFDWSISENAKSLMRG